MSGSCGWAQSGSTKKTTTSTAPVATRAAICASPPSGPLKRSSTWSPTFSRTSRAVCRVAIRSNCAKVSRLKVAQATTSAFLLSCAIKASRRAMSQCASLVCSVP
jgi:hypothetical protein